MLKTGEIQKLTVGRFTGNGAYLTDGEDNEVLLPNRYIDDKLEVGDSLDVFIYFDSEDRPVATTDYPYAMVGEVALMEVVDVNRAGAFLDWGLPKDLFVPLSNQTIRMTTGRWYIVYVYVDELTGRLVGTAKIGKFIRNDEISVKVGEKVEIVVAEENEYGFRVVVNNTHWGMIYHNQIFKKVRVGDILTAYVTKTTEDNRIDLSLNRVGVDNIIDSVRTLEQALDNNGGKLELGDDSSPEEIYKILNMSKKSFKRAVGSLYKDGKVELSNSWIKRK